MCIVIEWKTFQEIQKLDTWIDYFEEQEPSD